jgi:hypothetical protein
MFMEASILRSGDKPEILARIVAAKTPAEIQRVFIEMGNENARWVGGVKFS